MSVYNFLSTPVPTIAYCAMHQALPQVPTNEYMKTMRELHARISAETEAINAGYASFLRETVGRESESLHGSLSQFLQTPISSDNAEVQRTLRESLERLRDELIVHGGLGLKYSVEGKFVFAPLKKTLERKLLLNGKTGLEEMGVTFGKGRGEVFESMFVVHGGQNLDILEHVVRDKLGIYATTHGKHIKEFDAYAYTVYNLVHVRGRMPDSSLRGTYFEADFFFSKPDVKYASFRNAFVVVIDKFAAESSVEHVSLWQRKLGLGKTKEFVLRIVCSSLKSVSAIVHWFDSYKEEVFIRQALVRDGSLLIKELLF
ncbi:MAG: hypothetical protein O7D34_09050 [Ignavibacteria bacterium]|nr:hypothetical protein [Ignavibacteria bacterium]